MDSEKVKVAAGVIIQYGDKVLMCKRAENKVYGGQWSIPMGHVERNESPLNGATREFYEETNIKLGGDIKLIDIITKDSGTIIYVYYKNSGRELIPDLENAKDGFEHTECGYYSYDELPFENEDDDEIYKIIARVLRR
jgi:ADP-ribose pyrophosphatase YjhB (NUDIX family)